MRAIKKSSFLSLLFFAALFVQDASAAVMLPESSYAPDQWQGSVFYNQAWGDKFLQGRIDFAVYDTDNLYLSGETAFTDQLSLPGRYIYAYQVFNNLDESDESVIYFAVFKPNGGAPLDVDESSIGSQDDGNSGVQPSGEYFSDDKRKVFWEFKGIEGGLIYKGDHSWFLVFSSNSAPVVGNYEVKGPEADVPIPEEIPEPAMIALISLGGTLVMCRGRRKSVK